MGKPNFNRMTRIPMYVQREMRENQEQSKKAKEVNMEQQKRETEEERASTFSGEYRGAVVAIALTDGHEITGRLKACSKFEFLLDQDGTELIVFKHSVLTMKKVRQ